MKMILVNGREFLGLRFFDKLLHLSITEFYRRISKHYFGLQKSHAGYLHH